MADKVIHVLNPVTRTQVLQELAALEGPHEITVKPIPIRNAEQNRKLWACLQDISSQVVWYGQNYSKDEWKDILTAGLKRQKLVPGVDGGLVLVGTHTSRMSVRDMVDLIEFAMWFGAEHGVKFGAPETA